MLLSLGYLTISLHGQWLIGADQYFVSKC
jgi:hypothetical protein